METNAATKPLRTIQVIASRIESIDDLIPRVETYLYSNFEIATVTGDTIVINGYDSAGWTAESQTARMQSGLIAAKVVR